MPSGGHPLRRLTRVSRPRVALPLGAACVAMLAAGVPAVSEPAQDAQQSREPKQAGPPLAAMRAAKIEDVSVENVADFVSVRVRHAGAYWDGHTDIQIGADGKGSYPYRVSVERGESRAALHRSGGGDWKCSGARASASDAGSETLVVIPRSCFDSDAEQVRARATSYSGGEQVSTGEQGDVRRTEKPNVVVVMSDDMRDDELDGPWMQRTRHWFGDGGVQFQNSFAPLPLCAPARASFLTGQYAHNHGVWSHRRPYGFSVFRDQETLPVWLQRGGYNTFMLGKYINGYGERSMPAPNGRPSEHYVPPGWDDWRASLDNRGTYNYERTHLNNNGRIQSLVGRYQTNAYGKIASNEVDRQSQTGNPFFMYLSFTAPHHGAPAEDDDPEAVIDLEGEKYRIKTPAVPKAERGRWDADVPLAPGAGSEQDMSDKPRFMQRLPGMTSSEQDGVRELARQRAEALGVLDRSVDEVMSELRKRDELDNTYVVFTSDNGYFLGEHRMRQGKTLPYEPSLRTPTLIRGPGIPAGQTRTDPFLTIDFAPTILRMAGMSTDQGLPIDGRPMLDIAENGDHGWSRPVVTETGPTTVPTLMDLSGDTVGKDPNRLSKATRIKGIRTPDYLFTETSGREPELYDLQKDPGEVQSVIGDDKFSDTSRVLESLLSRMQTCIGEECRIGMPKQLREEPADDGTSDHGASDDGDGRHHDEKPDRDAKPDDNGKSDDEAKPDAELDDEAKPDATVGPGGEQGGGS